MPLHWTIDAKHRTFDIVADGDVTIVEAMAFLDDIERRAALPYQKLVDGTHGRADMLPEDIMTIAVRVREHHRISAVGPLAVVASAEQAQQFARVLGAAAVAKRPMKVFDQVSQARRWLKEQATRHP
jgi:hypothetical protein